MRYAVLCLLLLLSCTACAQPKKAQRRTTPAGATDYKSIGAPLPEIALREWNGRSLSAGNFQQAEHLIVMFFNPTCGHCELMTDAFLKDTALLRNNIVVLVAGGNMDDYLGDFVTNHHLSGVRNVYVTTDKSGFIDKAYNYKSLPQVNVYGPDRKLKLVLSGITTTDGLVQFRN